MPANNDACWSLDRAGVALSGRAAGPLTDPARNRLDVRIKLAGYDIIDARYDLHVGTYSRPGAVGDVVDSMWANYAVGEAIVQRCGLTTNDLTLSLRCKLAAPDDGDAHRVLISLLTPGAGPQGQEAVAVEYDVNGRSLTVRLASPHRRYTTAPEISVDELNDRWALVILTLHEGNARLYVNGVELALELVREEPTPAGGAARLATCSLATRCNPAMASATCFAARAAQPMAHRCCRPGAVAARTVTSSCGTRPSRRRTYAPSLPSGASSRGPSRSSPSMCWPWPTAKQRGDHLCSLGYLHST
eukprot:m.216367 g.216367  ORF g.216367 m.216367 type:complete len:303 (-) comp10153_c1_seq8:13-921(-)